MLLVGCQKDNSESGKGGSESEDLFNGHEYVDLGLTSGTLWATCNVGATKPEEYGDYFAWGETSGYNSGKTIFELNTYKWNNGSNFNITKYGTNGNFGIVDNKTELEIADDAARANWGGKWRMPSRAQIEELINECNAEWTSQNSVNGHKFTSKKNGKSIFLPAAGFRTGSSLVETRYEGDYWSCSLNESSNAYALLIIPRDFGRGVQDRVMGVSVRPVVSK